MAKNVIVLSNLGIGDNFYMAGACNYLTQFYDHVLLVVKHKNYALVSAALDTDKIHCVDLPVDEEWLPEADRHHKVVARYLSLYYPLDTYDVLQASDWYVQNYPTKITNHGFRAVYDAYVHAPVDPKYDMVFDTLDNQSYDFIKFFYNNLHLDLSHFYELWYMNDSEKSRSLYAAVQDWRIVFVQGMTSTGDKLDITNVIQRCVPEDKTLIVSPDFNVYDAKVWPQKHRLAQQFVRNQIHSCLATIQHADEIYIIDSAFTGIVLPLVKTGRLPLAKVVRIIRRGLPIRA